MRLSAVTWMVPLGLGIGHEYYTTGTFRDNSILLMCIAAAIILFGLFMKRPIARTRQQKQQLQELEQKKDDDAFVPYSMTKPETPLPLTQTLPVSKKGKIGMSIFLQSLEMLATKLALALGFRQYPIVLSLDSPDLAMPDTPVAKAARELCEKAAGPGGEFVVQHCLRTYLFGAAIAEQLGTDFDRETLYVAALLHCLAWTKEYDDDRLDFEVAGAKHALEFCQKHKLKDHQARVIHEMIALHTSPALLKDIPAELRLVNQGQGVDVAAFLAEEIHPTTLQNILKAHPRMGFRQRYTAVMLDQYRRKPHTHMAMWVVVGLLEMAQNLGPFVE